VTAFSTRTGGIAGAIGAVLLVVAGLLTGSPPKTDDSASKVTAYLVDKRDAIRWQIVLFAVAILLIFWFTAAFGALMARTDGISPVHAALPLAGFTAILAIGFGGGAPFAAVVWRGPTSLSPDLARFAWDVNNLASSFIGIAAVLIFLASAALIMRSAALPAWLGWLALVAAVINAFGVLAILFDADKTALAPGGIVPGVLCLVAAAVWILAASVTMIQTRDPRSS
jgi:hypothetical protein